MTQYLEEVDLHIYRIKVNPAFKFNIIKKYINGMGYNIIRENKIFSVLWVVNPDNTLYMESLENQVWIHKISYQGKSNERKLCFI